MQRAINRGIAGMAENHKNEQTAKQSKHDSAEPHYKGQAVNLEL